MLEKLPPWFGRALKGMRPGLPKLVSGRAEIGSVPRSLVLTSPEFGEGAPIPPRYTADGTAVSPPLAWGPVPPQARSLVLIVEDADSPTPMPLVHAIVWGIPPTACVLPESAIAHTADGPPTGQNSYLKPDWLPPDPPPGHGPHRYAFQLFALDQVPELTGHPGRRAVIAAIQGHVIARGQLIGTYERK